MSSVYFDSHGLSNVYCKYCSLNLTRINMGLKFIYCGYSKTGTKTIAAVFRTLGFTVHDYEETALYNIKAWLKFLDPKTTHSQKITLLRETFENVDVVTDAPHFFYWEQLLEAFHFIFWLTIS